MKTALANILPPEQDECHEYYLKYISQFHAEIFLEGFAGQIDDLKNLVGNLPPGVDSQLHEPYTWTLKQVVGHLIDVERIFSTRLLRIGVGDESSIPGMEQNIYVANLNYEEVTMQNLLDEFGHLRSANVLLAKRMSNESLARRGVASGYEVSAKANLFILAGHVVHHSEIIKRRLGKS